MGSLSVEIFANWCRFSKLGVSSLSLLFNVVQESSETKVLSLFRTSNQRIAAYFLSSQKCPVTVNAWQERRSHLQWDVLSPWAWWGCPVGFTAGATIPGHPLSQGAPPAIKSQSLRKERRVSQVTIRCLERECPLIIYWKCEHCGYMAGSRDGMQIVHLMGLNSRPPAWGSYTWPTPFPLVCLNRILPWCDFTKVCEIFFTDSQKIEGFLVFVLPGGPFIMQDCHGEAVQLSLLGHIYMFKCVTRVTKVLHFKGKTLSQILHTITSTTLIWKPQADAKSEMEWMLSVRRLIYDQYEALCLSRVVLSCGRKILHHKVHVNFFLMLFLRQSPNWNLSGFTWAGTKMYFLRFNTVP